MKLGHGWSEFLTGGVHGDECGAGLADIGAGADFGGDAWQRTFAAANHIDLIWPAGAVGSIAALSEKRNREVEDFVWGQSRNRLLLIGGRFERGVEFLHC